MRSIFRIAFILLSTCTTIFGQHHHAPQGQYKINQITNENGLSNNQIRAIIQDSTGFVWFGTQSGLNRYDGYSIKNYWPDPEDSTSISSTTVYAFLIDDEKQLWIAGDRGIDIYNHEKDNFTFFDHKDLEWPESTILSIVQDQNGVIWMAGSTGLISYNKKTDKLHIYKSVSGNDELFMKGINNLHVDDKNRILIAITNHALCIFDPKENKFTLLKSDPNNENTLSSNRIERIYTDRSGNIWFGTLNDGLCLFLPESNTCKRFVIDPENTYSNRVRAIFEDFKGNFFVGTRGGLYMLDKNTGKYVLYASEDHNFSKLSQNSVYSSYIDKSGTLWIGTFSGGVNYIYLHKKNFTHYPAGKHDNYYLSGGNIYAITEDSNGNLWIGGDNGLNFLDRTTSMFQYFQSEAGNPNSLTYNDVKALEWETENKLWIATNKGGLNKYDLTSKKFSAFRHDPDNPKSIRGDHVYCIKKDSRNNLWIIAAHNSDRKALGIDILPEGKKEFVHLSEKPFFGIDEDKTGNMYVGGLNGFWFFNRSDSVYTHYTNEKCIQNANVIKCDSEKNIWIGSNMGLARYNLQDKKWLLFSKETGYPIEEVFGIIEDAKSNLWVTTSSGMIRMDGIVKDMNNFAYKIFDKMDGLQSNQFNFNAFYKCKSGEIAVGGANGINTFFPEEIHPDSIQARVILTDLKIYNESVPIDTEVLGSVVLDKAISETKEIHLQPNQKIFTLEFATLHKVSPYKYAFRTKLKGLDKDWQLRKAGNNQVTYTNLTPGEYTFMVSASNQDGYWNPEPSTLKITVATPLWKTWWFILLASITFLALLISSYLYRIRSIRVQNILLENTVKKRTEEITEKNKMLESANNLLIEKQDEIITQKDELEQHRNHLADLVKARTADLEEALTKAKESDELKSAFLANMSHEIRTPMNAIIGFSDLLREFGDSPEKQEEFIEIIQSNSRYLLQIIDEIIALSIIESQQLIIHNETFDLNTIIDHAFSFYQQSNKNKSIEIKKSNKLEAENLKLYSDSTHIKQIITNLMDNALKFTKQGFIELGAFRKNNLLHIYVEDTGKGIPDEQLENIFERFVRLDDDTTTLIRGVGLGLSISKSIAEAIGGNLTVRTEIGKGSVFTLIIPLVVITQQKANFTAEQNLAALPNWSGKTLIVAEDVDTNFLYLERLLNRTQVEIIWAKNGLEALQKLDENPHVSVILMDIKMPKLNGYDAAKMIREKYPAKKIIAQTAYAHPQEKAKFYDRNFDDYLAKPIDKTTLFSVLGAFLEGDV